MIMRTKILFYQTFVFSMAALMMICSTGFASEPRKLLVSADELHAMMADEHSKPLIFEVAWGGPEEDYAKGHIPTSMHLNTDLLEYDEFHKRSATPAKKLGRSTTVEQDQAKGLGADDSLARNWWNIYPDQYLFPAFAALGIDLNQTVVLYGKDMTAAARAAWALLYAGVENVRLLDGGLTGWKKAGYAISKEPTLPKPVESFGTEKALHPEYLVDVAFVRTAVTEKDDHVVIADIRTRREYQGEAAPYSYIPTMGRIAGAKWGHAGHGPWTMDYYVDGKGYFVDPVKVEERWKEAGITGDKHVAFYCGTAWRSSLAFLYAYMLGWDEISNFDSSWYEWSMGPEKELNPIE